MRVIEKEKIILATGSEEVNNAVIEFASQSKQNFYSFEQVHYREFLLEDYSKFNICIISKILPGEMEFDKLIYQLKSKNIRVILILLEENKEELEICIKYHISDVLTQPVKPIDVLDIIKNPKTFKDIEFIYKKFGLDLNLSTSNDSIKASKKEEKSNNLFKKNTFEKAEKSTKEIIKYKQSVIGAKNIGISNLSSGAGATFFALNFAKALSEFTKVGVIEHPLIRPRIYNTVGIANHLEKEDDFVSYAHNIKDNISDKKEAFVKDNITFIVTDPNKEQIIEEDWDENKMLRLIYLSKMPVNVIDLGDKLFDISVINIIEQFTCVFVIIDPYVPCVIESLDMLEKIKHEEKKNGLKIKYVINKFNDGYDETEVLSMLDIYPIANIPFVDPQYIYLAAHKNKIAYDFEEVRKSLKHPFENIIKEIIPEELSNFKNKKSIFRFFK